ncbi:MAG: hypothetical protein QF551_02850 [Candidatus Marinimicrobia bacterium]|jgi:putative protease|nr:hypothetical protein [Candidatus Neomarinimicrobiota bacterium]MDP6966195.1 hypothetical protein [Candidatus Neomarinimicrobiota bacterium]|tara:strand:+ start:224 stop:496 length:273 start_codon:yes stop_codon:yes gene_type:complete
MSAKAKEQEIGYVSTYFRKINVAGIEITKGSLEVGDTIHIKGHTSDFTETVKSMQIEHDSVEKVKKGNSIGLKVSDVVRRHDKVYKVTQA